MTRLPTSPATRLETWLTNLDGDHIAALVGAFVVLVFVLCMIPSIIVRLGKTEPVARTQPASSHRKAPRTGVSR